MAYGGPQDNVGSHSPGGQSRDHSMATDHSIMQDHSTIAHSLNICRTTSSYYVGPAMFSPSSMIMSYQTHNGSSRDLTAQCGAQDWPNPTRWSTR